MNYSFKFVCKTNLLKYTTCKEILKLNYSRFAHREKINNPNKSSKERRRTQPAVEEPKKQDAKDETKPNFKILEKNDFMITYMI